MIHLLSNKDPIIYNSSNELNTQSLLQYMIRYIITYIGSRCEVATVGNRSVGYGQASRR